MTKSSEGARDPTGDDRRGWRGRAGRSRGSWHPSAANPRDAVSAPRAGSERVAGGRARRSRGWAVGWVLSQRHRGFGGWVAATLQAVIDPLSY